MPNNQSLLSRTTRLLRSVFLGCSALFFITACTQAANNNDSSKLKQAFEQRFPGQKVLSVSNTPLTNIFEVVTVDKKIVYSNTDASYLFVGDLIDTVNKNSLTEQKITQLYKVDFKTLPFDKAIKDVRGTGERQLAVFSDPDCPYCKKLERESLVGLQNDTIYTFLYPISELHPDATRKAQQIWCAADPLQAWAGWMREGKALTGKTNCKTPLDELQALGKTLGPGGLSGTPTLVFANGKMRSGALETSEIEQHLQEK